MRRLPLAALAVTGLVAGIIGMAVPTLASTPAPAPAATQAPTPVRTAAAPSAITEHYTGTLVFVNFSVDRCIGIAGGKAGIYTCTFVNDQAWQVIATKTVSGNTYAQRITRVSAWASRNHESSARRAIVPTMGNTGTIP